MAAAADVMMSALGGELLPFAAVHQRFDRPLRRFFASYRLNAADAADLTQEVFLRLAQQRCGHNVEKPEAFVFTLARNLLRDRARRFHTRAAAGSIAVEELELACERASPCEQVEQGERLVKALEALGKLKHTTQRAFVLRRVHGLSYAEVACELGVSVSMVEKHVMTANAALHSIDGSA